MTKKIAVLTSGGDAPGMNAVIRAVVRKGIYHGFTVYGVERGFQGVMEGSFAPMNLHSVAAIIQHGGTVLKTARCEAFKTAAGQAQALAQLRRQGIDVLIVVGGDGSMAGAACLAAAGLPVVVVPATIDNDMTGTEYAIGFDTALNTVLEAVNKIRDTAASHERVAVVEVMGRQAGHIALMAGLACGAEVVLLPEHPLDMDKVCQRLERSYRRGKLYSIVLVAEGAGRGYDVAAAIEQRTPFHPHVTVLGYIQRGGSPSALDNIMASRMGAMAVDCVLAGRCDVLIAWQQGRLLAVPLAEAQRQPHRLDLSLYELTGILAQ